jgi:bifunctional non-homologous end joining protein LigD
VVDTSPTMTDPRHWVDVSPADMLDMFAAVAMEGIVAKHLDSPLARVDADASGTLVG